MLWKTYRRALIVLDKEEWLSLGNSHVGHTRSHFGRMIQCSEMVGVGMQMGIR